MSRLSRFRPSPAMVIASVALFVALGGTGYAVTELNGRDIDNRSISGKKLKKNTVTDKEVRESRLKRVPEAKVADFLKTTTVIPVQKLPVGQTKRIPVAAVGSGARAASGLDDIGALVAVCSALSNPPRTGVQVFFVAAVDNVGFGGGTAGRELDRGQNTRATFQLTDDGDPEGDFEGEPYGDAFVVGPDGDQYKIQLWIAVNMFGAPCAVGGQVHGLDPGLKLAG
jgi:hypothetical protein